MANIEIDRVSTENEYLKLKIELLEQRQQRTDEKIKNIVKYLYSKDKIQEFEIKLALNS